MKNGVIMESVLLNMLLIEIRNPYASYTHITQHALQVIRFIMQKRLNFCVNVNIEVPSINIFCPDIFKIYNNQ
jgi:hypothetical protein